MILRRPRLSFLETFKYVDGIVYKFCMDCEEWKPLDGERFYRNRSNGIDGFYNICKLCNIQRSGKSQSERRNQTILYKRHWYRKHKKSEAEKAKERYQDPEKRKKKLERCKKYRINHPERMRQYSRNHAKHNITSYEWVSCKEYFNCSCAYCGISEFEAKKKYIHGLHKEHVIPGGRNDIKNCVPACLQCNSEKNIHSLNNWYNETNPKYDKQRHLKIVQWIKLKLHRI